MLDRTVAPAFRQIKEIHFKQPERFSINNNVDFFSIQAGTQPVIKLELIFNAGKWFEEKPGAAFFCSKMLREGTKNLSSYDISSLFESYGAHLEIISTLDFTSITIYCLEKYLEKVLHVIKAMAVNPSFPEEEFETLKNIQIQTLRVNNEKNNFLASKKFRECLFDKSHPYGHILDEGDILSLERIDLENHFHNTIHNRAFTIIGSGLYDHSTIQMVKNTFSDTPLSENLKEYSYKFDLHHQDVYVEKEKSSQSSIRMGYVTIPMDHKDYPGLIVANEILGGYFGSRLMKNIREEKGLTYGIYSSLSNLKNATFLSISADVKKELRTKAIEEIQKEIKKLGSELVSIEELETVKNYMLGQIQASVNTPFALAAKFKNIYFHGLGYEYYSNLIETIRNISPERIRELAKKYLRAEEMVKVCVG